MHTCMCAEGHACVHAFLRDVHAYMGEILPTTISTARSFILMRRLRKVLAVRLTAGFRMESEEDEDDDEDEARAGEEGELRTPRLLRSLNCELKKEPE